jgi:cell wall-associated NlpC family hydrolase
LDKIIKIFFFFLVIAVLSLAESSCRSSTSSYSRRSSTTGKDYVRKKSKSGNKRSNHRTTSTSRRSTAGNASYSKSKTPSASVSSTNNKKANGQAIQVIKTARSYIGTPYRYGGSTGKGMDCSGLLCTSFQAVNVKLPRTSHEQSTYGKDIQLNDIEPGDLVFFTERKGSNKVSHVGMVTEVRSKNEVKFIHASTSRGVTEDNLFNEYYQKIFVKAIRPF